MREITLNFHNSLLPYTYGNKSFTAQVNSYADLLFCCFNFFPKLKDLAKQMINKQHSDFAIIIDKKILSNDRMLFLPSANKTLTLVPLLIGKGSNGGILMIVAGIAILALAIFTAGTALAAAMPAMAAGGVAQTTAVSIAAAVSAGTFTGLTTLGQLLVGLAASLILGGIQSLTAKAPKNKPTVDSSIRKNNDSFSSLDNSTNSNTDLCLIFGRNRIAGQFVSGSIKSITHAKNDIIRVAENIV